VGLGSAETPGGVATNGVEETLTRIPVLGYTDDDVGESLIQYLDRALAMYSNVSLPLSDVPSIGLQPHAGEIIADRPEKR
jgi:hypothetical protein